MQIISIETRYHSNITHGLVLINKYSQHTVNRYVHEFIIDVMLRHIDTHYSECLTSKGKFSYNNIHSQTLDTIFSISMSVSTSLCSKVSGGPAGWEGPATATGFGGGDAEAATSGDVGVASSSASNCSAKSSSPGGGFSLFNSSLNCSK